MSSLGRDGFVCGAGTAGNAFAKQQSASVEIASLPVR
jgi:hypothetical protein